MNEYFYFKLTRFFNNIFRKRNKELWFEVREYELDPYLIFINTKLKYTPDPKYWDSMYDPEITMYYKEVDCSSFANLNFEYLKHHNIPCKLYALKSWDITKGGHAIVCSDLGTFSNQTYYSEIFTPDDFNNKRCSAKYNTDRYDVLREYKNK